MAEAEEVDELGKHFQRMFLGEEAGGLPEPDVGENEEIPVTDLPGLANSDNSFAGEAADSDSDTEEEEEEKPAQKKKMPNFGDNFLDGLSVKPAQATSSQQEARLQSVQAQTYIDL